jgi:imidazolonepropionase-like amidohydrolase
MENFLRRYIYAGITTVVDVGSTINFLKQRDTFRTKAYAPDVYMTGPLLTTWESPVYKELKDDEPMYEMKTVNDARKYVQQQLPYRPDFIKIGYLLPGANKDSLAKQYFPLVQAAVEEAHKHGLRVAVHATERITSLLAVQAGADHLVHGVDDEPVDATYLQLLKKKNVVVTSSLKVFEGYRITFGQQYKLTETDFKYAHPTPLNSIIDFKHIPDTALRQKFLTRIETNRQRAKTSDSLLRRNLKRLSENNVTIATGTDAGNIGTQHVSSYFTELAAMQQSGMSMWQLLQSSTINGAKAVGKEAEFGSVAKGKKANIVLLNKNPLDSISNWKSIDWVINKGVALIPDSVFRLSPLEVVEKQALAYNAHNVDLYMQTIDDSIEIFRLPKKKNVVVTSSLKVFEGYRITFGQQYKLTETDFKYAHPTPLNSIIDFKHIPDTALRQKFLTRIETNRQRAKTSDSLLRRNLKRLSENNVTIATGTDAGNIGTQHVSSYFTELAAMQQSGMSMWQLLQSSTINGAKAVGKEAEFGSVAKGKKANIVLLNKNPLDSISNWKSIDWVINKGVALIPDSVFRLSPLEVVEKQALAYNAHNVDLYMQTIDDSIEIFRLPRLQIDLVGKDSVRKGYEFLNSSPDLYCRILNRIVERNMIVDHEEVYFQNSAKPFYFIAVYHVRNGRIKRMYFY